MSYTAAEDVCANNITNGAHLAYIKDDETHSAVKTYLQSLPAIVGYDLAWIGATYDVSLCSCIYFI